MKETTFRMEDDIKNDVRIKEITKNMPDCVREYISARKVNTTSKTRLVYAYDLKRFVNWVEENTSINELENTTSLQINDYIEYCQTECGVKSAQGILKITTAISSFFAYMYKHNKIVANPCDRIERPKTPRNNEIIKLNRDEVNDLLIAIKNGTDAMTEHQNAYLDNSRTRDYAIAKLMLNTGIRVSECVGLNINDINFNEYKISIDRKGRKKQFVAISDETIDALKAYIAEREQSDADTDALFLSSQNKRMCVNSIESMIKKYALAVGLSEKITPHKLRKTFGTELYNKTNDIHLVANALGHENINTTQKYYVANNEQRLIDARNIVAL